MNAPHPLPVVTTPAQNFIGNRWVAPAGGETLPMLDPSDGKPFAAIARGNAADIDAAVRAAHTARAGAWGRLSPAERGRLLGKLSRAILDHAEELALTEARDCGKPLTQARADVTRARAISNSMAAPATSCMGRPFPILKVSRS